MMPQEVDVNCDGDSSSNDEGDNNKSFVKKVKNHVTGFLPTKLSNWLGGKNRQRDEEDSYELQPPPKRVKRHSENFGRTSYACNNSFRPEFREPVAGPSVSTRKLVLPGSSFNQNQAVQTNGVDSDSGESTSGYSSMPRIGSKEHVSDLSRQNVQQNCVNNSVGNKSIFNTSIPMERTLFGERLSEPKKQNTSLSSRRPSFNSSAFGAPNFLDRTLTTRRIIDSPFYHGRIAYGGASAYNRSLIASSPEAASPRPSVKPIQVNDNQNAALSKTAQRILYTLENYTSPAQDVRRIPRDQRRTKPCSLLGQFQSANPYTMREYLRQPSNRELQVPSTSDLLRMKLRDKMNDSTMQLREIAKSSNLTVNDEYSLGNREESEPSTKSTNKIKTKVSSVRQKTNLVDDAIPEVNLPDVQLPISTLPTFNFSMPFSKPKEIASVPEKNDAMSSFKSTDKSDTTQPIASIASAITANPVATAPINFKSPDLKATAILSPVSKISTPPKLQSALEETKKLVQVTSTEFKFSSPLIIAENKFNTLKSINDYKFSNPLVKKVLNGLPPISKVTFLSVTSLPKKGFGDAFKKSDDKWECSECMVKNVSSTTACICCTNPKAAAKPAVNGPSKTIPAVSAFNVSTASSWGDKFKTAKGSWTCAECMITNDVSKENCVACETPKSGATAAPQVTASSMLNFGKKADEWQCPSCMVNNANAKEKCICCETFKPGAKPATTSTFNLSSFATTKSDTWECSVCMIRNKLEKAKCEACENPRPAKVAPPKEMDGFMKDNEWECSSCMVRNPSSKGKCVCCEAPKPGSKPVPTAQVKEVPKFSFGIENGLINGQGFMFGIPAGKNVKTDEKKVDFAAVVEKSKSEAPSTQFTFGIKSLNGAKTTLPTVTASVAEVAAVKPNVPATPAFTFGAPAATGNKHSASGDESDAAKSSRKDSTLPVNPVNGSLNKADVTKVEPPKFAFGVINNAPLSASSTASTLFGGSALPKPAALGLAATSAPTFDSNTTTSTPSFSFNAATTAFNARRNDLVSPPAPEKPAAPVFKFGGNAAAPTATPSLLGVGSNATNGPTPTPSFNFSAIPAKSVNPEGSTPSPAFKFGATDNKPAFGSAAATAASTFGSGSNSTSMFRASSATNNAFGIANHNTTPAAPAPTFRNSSALTFGSSNTSAPLAFGAAKIDPPTFGAPSLPPIFGGSTAAAPTFGKPTTNGLGFGATNNSASEVKPAFNFGSSATIPPTAGTFSFGSTAGAQSTNGTFSFGGNSAAPTMNGTASPAFNFTAATPSASSFSVPPTDSRPAQNRVIRRAVRRTQR